MMEREFVHLHVHTQYSLLDGAAHLERLVEKAKEFSMPALAITDHGNLFGAVKFYQLCEENNIKPIIGCEFYVAGQSRFKKEGGESNFHLLLLAKNEEGYKNLVKLVSLSNIEGFYYKPRIDKELLERYSCGLIGLSGCLKGEIPSLILEERTNQAFKKADEYLSILGKDNFYLELMDNGLKEQYKVNEVLLKISKDLKIPVVATNDIHYINQDEAFAHEVLLCLQTQTTLDDPTHFRFNSDTFYFRSPQEMHRLFSWHPEALNNTLEISQKCNFKFNFSSYSLPRFPLPEEEADEFQYLKKLCYKNLKKRYPQSSKDIIERLEYELRIIKDTGFSSYFLIIQDIVKFAKERKIPVGPGRGSSAGSIVSYLLEITDIDPLKYGLLFERFLNPQRVSMPDIDIDFCYERRGEVLEYIARKYGRECVAQIITFGTLLARAVVRDVGRVLGLSYSEVDRIAKMIPHPIGHQITLKEALQLNPELKDIYERDSRIKRLIDTALKLEGLSRHASTHAAGVVISDRPLMERIPLAKAQEGEIVTGLDMESLEKLGLLKMDILGLKTLTVIDQTLKIIRRTKGVDIDIGKIPLDDKKTFRLLAEGETIGVFQLESQGMRQILKRLKPTEFKDLIAVLALHRPGPLGSGLVSDFIERKQEKKPITYLHSALEPILKETYGIILYQEQTMQIASYLAGFSLSQADLLRKAIGKKIPEIMEEQRSLFIQGCLRHGISQEIAFKIFNLIDYFSGYGFNKSHSTAYALISYRTAFLKANFPVEFMTALLTSERTNTDKIVEYINEAKRLGIKVLPPDINYSFANFTVTEEGNIRFGLLAIKNVGEAALENIIQLRKERKFESFFDFCLRVDKRAVNKKVMESLIKSGAMDSFGLKRAQMFVLLDKVLEMGNLRTQQQLFLFSFSPKIPQIEEWPKNDLLRFEKELLGLYVSSHPVSRYKHLYSYLKAENIASFYEEEKERDVCTIGVIDKIKVTITRRDKEKMAILRIGDETQNIEVFVFPKLYQEVGVLLKETKIIFVEGRLQMKEKIPKIVASKVIEIDKIWEKISTLNIALTSKVDIERLKEILSSHRGSIPLVLTLRRKNSLPLKITPSQNFYLKVNKDLLEELKSIVGEENLSLTLQD